MTNYLITSWPPLAIKTSANRLSMDATSPSKMLERVEGLRGSFWDYVLNMVLWLTVGILLGVGCLVFADDTHCPSDIFPCHCDSNDYEQLTIRCERVKNVDQLHPVLNKTRGLDVSFLFHGGVGDIPSNLFQGQKSRVVTFFFANVRSVGTRPFSGLEDYLEELKVQHSVHNDLSLPLGHLKKLRVFEFEYNSGVKRLGNEWFRGGPTTLQEVKIIGNNFKEIGDRVFADVLHLEELRLSDNKFDEISRSMFPRPAKALQKLYLDYNSIQHLTEDVFEDMPKLRLLRLSSNRLTTLSEAVFGRIWGQLEEFSLYSDKNLKCDFRMKWILSRKSETPEKIRGTCKYKGRKINLEDFLKKEPSDIEDSE